MFNIKPIRSAQTTMIANIANRMHRKTFFLDKISKCRRDENIPMLNAVFHRIIGRGTVQTPHNASTLVLMREYRSDVGAIFIDILVRQTIGREPFRYETPGFLDYA